MYRTVNLSLDFHNIEGKPKSGIINQFVQWEESNNALIVRAKPDLMRSIKSIIAKLDIRRPQVLIEVILAEVNLEKSQSYGIEWSPSPKASVKFGTRFPTATTANSIVGGFADGVVGTLGRGLSVGVFRHGSLRTLMQLLATDSNANILSTPTLVTLDNQPALIKVGEKVPFAIGQTNNDDIGGNPFTSFDREEVGLSLTIKPQISPSGEIRLQIENILSNIIPNSENQNTGGNPRTSERTIITNVMVKDGKILVLGGLIQDSWQKVRDKVPIVGDMPIFGNLFKKMSQQYVKKNLLIFLRPKIIYHNDQGIKISTDKYEQMRKHQILSYSKGNPPFTDEPVIAPALGMNDFYYNDENNKVYYPTNVILPLPFDK